ITEKPIPEQIGLNVIATHCFSINNPNAIPASVTCDKASANRDNLLTTKKVPSNGATIPIKTPVKNVYLKKSNSNISANMLFTPNRGHELSLELDVRKYEINPL